MNEQQAINQEILSSLQDIHSQNEQIAKKIDDLEQTVTKKATIAGATAGAITGGIASGIVSVGIELIRAKFGG